MADGEQIQKSDNQRLASTARGGNSGTYPGVAQGILGQQGRSALGPTVRGGRQEARTDTVGTGAIGERQTHAATARGGTVRVTPRVETGESNTAP